MCVCVCVCGFRQLSSAGHLCLPADFLSAVNRGIQPPAVQKLKCHVHDSYATDAIMKYDFVAPRLNLWAIRCSCHWWSHILLTAALLHHCCISGRAPSTQWAFGGAVSSPISQKLGRVRPIPEPGPPAYAAMPIRPEVSKIR